MKTYGGIGSISPGIFHLSTRWRWVVSFHAPAALPSGERAPGTHCIRDWVWKDWNKMIWEIFLKMGNCKTWNSPGVNFRAFAFLIYI
jgi:hypothetical protein